MGRTDVLVVMALNLVLSTGACDTPQEEGGGGDESESTRASATDEPDTSEVDRETGEETARNEDKPEGSEAESPPRNATRLNWSPDGTRIIFEDVRPTRGPDFN